MRDGGAQWHEAAVAVRAVTLFFAVFRSGLSNVRLLLALLSLVFACCAHVEQADDSICSEFRELKGPRMAKSIELSSPNSIARIASA
jgi:hypothetical protein